MELLVDSGAPATVMGPKSIKSVNPSEHNPSNNYRLADGGLIRNRGEKYFLGIMEEGIARRLKAQVTDVDGPLMSVARIVQNGGRVVFHKKGSCVEGEGKHIALAYDGGLYKMIMWVPREQAHPVDKLTRAFHGQAKTRL